MVFMLPLFSLRTSSQMTLGHAQYLYCTPNIEEILYSTREMSGKSSQKLQISKRVANPNTKVYPRPNKYFFKRQLFFNNLKKTAKIGKNSKNWKKQQKLKNIIIVI